MKNVRKNNKKKDKTYKNTCFFVFLLTKSFSLSILLCICNTKITEKTVFITLHLSLNLYGVLEYRSYFCEEP